MSLKPYLEFLMDKYKNVKRKINVAGGVIIKKSETGDDILLLIQRSSDDNYPLFFEFPRGKCDKGDKNRLTDCLKREVKEETGLDVIPIKFIDKFTYIADEGERESTQYNYLCKLKDPNQEVKLSKEHQDYKWVSSVGEVELLCQPEIKKTISRVFNTEMKTVIYPEKNEEIEE